MRHCLAGVMLASVVASVSCDGSSSSRAVAPAPTTPPVSSTDPASDAVFGILLPYPRLAAGIETRQLLAGFVSPGDGGVVDVTAGTMWSTSEPAVLTVDSSGRVRGHTPGVATVTGTHSGRSASTDIGVIAPTVRTLSDLPDDFDGPQIHAFYVVPKDGDDRVLDRNGAVASSFEEIQQWTVANLGRRFRSDTHQGELDVTFVRLRESSEKAFASGLISTIQRNIAGAVPAGNKISAVYYDGRGESGIGGRALFPTGVTYLNGRRLVGSLFDFGGESTPLWFPFAMEFIMIHELFHTFGAVAACAPNADDGKHVTDDAQDIMSAERAIPAPEEGEKEEEVLAGFTWAVDRDHDDYYEHSNGLCRDIAESGFWEVVPDAGPRSEPAPFRSTLPLPLWPFLDGPLRCGIGSF